MVMRILTFSSLYPNAIQARHGIFVEQRLRHLLASGEVEAKVVAPVPWFPLSGAWFGRYATFAGVPAHDCRNGVEVEYPRYLLLPKIGMTLAPFLMALAMRPVLRRIIATGHDFDLIDAHYFYPDGVAAVLLGKWLGKPVVITARGTDINLIPDYRLPRRLILWAARRSAAIVTVSQALKLRLEQLGVAGRNITVLRNGVDLQLFQPVEQSDARRQLTITDAPTLLSVGNLVEGKGHQTVIEALTQLANTQLLIVGQGVFESRLRQLALNLGVAERVIFAGNVAQDQLKTWYSAADVLVLASRSEGMPNVLLEAMACGTQVIASQVGGIPEIVTAPEAGVVLKDCTAMTVADAIQQMLAFPKDPAATRRHAAQFSWEATSQGQLTLFKRILQHTAAALHIKTRKPVSNSRQGSHTKPGRQIDP